MEETILVLAEQREGNITPGTYEAVGCARTIQQYRPLPIVTVFIGEEVEEPARVLAQKTGGDVIAAQVSGLSSYNAEIYKNVLAQLTDRMNPTYLVIPHSTNGWDLAPALAVRLKSSCITGVEQVSAEGDVLTFSRSVFGGKAVAEVKATGPRTVVTVQGGAFRAAEAIVDATGAVETMSFDVAPDRMRSKGVIKAKEENSALTEAEVVVSAGRGIGKPENLKLIRDLANLFPKSAVGGSRPVCDAGWLDYSRQVGLTGATVTPKLYIACGISGASQHIAGMRGSGFIVAINKDPYAAICNVADVCVGEDLTTFIPILLETINKGTR